ncbi:MAG: RIO1 family regulatory kinase/ATPase [Candidatus Woesearchaeota archaeon]
MPKWKEKFEVWQDVFDNFTINNLKILINKGIFEELKGNIAVGKESNIFFALTKSNEKVIVKIYRLQTADFKRMFFYIRGDPRFKGLANKRRKVIFAWCQREFRNLINAQRARINAPKPIAFQKNILIMEFIGKENPAPSIKDSLPENVENFAKQVFKNIEKFAVHGFVHGDLSEFNILNYEGKPYFIDLSHSTPMRNQDSLNYLSRDVFNVCRFFNSVLHEEKYDAGEIVEKIVKKIPPDKLP